MAIGELADGLEIDLDKVPLKYQGLNGTEIAISESQERMAVAVSYTHLVMKTYFLKLIKFLKPKPSRLISLISLLVPSNFACEDCVFGAFLMYRLCLRKVLKTVLK